MLIAVISDTHSRHSSIHQALALMLDRGVEMILHCGDIQDGNTVRLFPPYTHFVYGNCDYDREDIQLAVQETGATLHGAWGVVQVAQFKLAMVHGDNHQLLSELENADAFDFLFHGHTHVAGEHRTGHTRVINPGALQRVVTRTFLLLDLPSGITETLYVT